MAVSSFFVALCLHRYALSGMVRCFLVSNCNFIDELCLPPLLHLILSMYVSLCASFFCCVFNSAFFLPYYAE